MNVIDTDVLGVKLVEPKVFGDDRGFFLETFQQDRYKKMLNIDLDFVQDNHSRSSQNVLRGRLGLLHPVRYAGSKPMTTFPFKGACISR